MVRLVNGLEFLGKSKNAGYAGETYLLHTPDDRYIELTKLLYQIVYVMQTENIPVRIAAEVSRIQNKEIDSKAIIFLVEKRLQPLGIFADKQINLIPQQKQPDPLLSLKYRFTLIPQKISERIAKFFSPLFRIPIMIGISIDFLLLNIWLFGFHGIDASLQRTIMEPFHFISIIALVLFSTLFHEFGHAAGTYFGGAKPGRIGAGLYIIWPAFFTDVSDIYRIHQRTRLKSDIGGVYFNMVFALITAAAYFITGYEPLLLVIALQNIAIVNQLLPFMRLDGYYIISDLVGIPDLFMRIKPILKNIFLRQKNAATRDLKTWVKWTVSLWVLITIPLMTLLLGFMLTNAPQVFAMAWTSTATLSGAINQSFAQNNYLLMSMQLVQLFVLLSPALSTGYLLFIIGRQFSKLYRRFDPNNQTIKMLLGSTR